MLIEAIILSVLIGWFRGGRLSKFRSLKEKSLWFLAIGILIQGAITFSNNFIGIESLDRILTYSKEIMLLSFILIVIGIVMNYKFKSLWITFVGFLMNFLAFFSNGWKKPILLEGLNLAGKASLIEVIKESSISLFTPIVEGVKYPILGNIIIFAKPYPMAKLVSIGDIIVGIGIFIFIQDIMFRESSFFRR